jgi:hypothetical protein
LNKKRYENQRDFKGYSSKRDVINCFDYKKSSHVKYDFPNAKKKWKHDKNKKKYDKKEMNATTCYYIK